MMRITLSTMSQRRGNAARLAAGAATVATLLLSGCGLGGGSATGVGNNPTSPALQLGGKVFGGQQPITGATIQLYAVGITGRATGATPLIGTTILTVAGGAFNITGTYTCPSSTSQVYITATGGNSGSGTNTAISLAAALGSCGTLQTNLPNILINELTTVAAAYTLAPFEGASYTFIGSTGTGPTAIVNSFSAASALVNFSSGAIPAPPAGVTLPTAELNTLADIIAACVNSTGPTSTGCSPLVTATGASDTFDAAFAIAKNPGSAAIVALYSQATATAPFQPILTSAPNDFTVAYRYAGSALSGPYGLAIDALGNGYVTNEAGFSVVGFPPVGTTFAAYTNTAAAAGGLAGPRGIAIDTTGFFWIANTGGANVVELAQLSNGTGGVISGFGTVNARAITLTGSAADAPVAVATDLSGNAYFANFTSNNIYAVSSGAAVSGTINSATLANPTSIALDSSLNLRIGNTAGAICTMPNTLAAPTCTAQSPAQAIAGVGVNVLTPANVGYATSLTGAALSGAYGPSVGSGPYSGGGLSLPTAVAFDGSGHAWLANTGSISVFNGAIAISPSTGYGTVSSPSGIAIDGSGNVWTANTGDNSISVFIGAATPVATPIASNI